MFYNHCNAYFHPEEASYLGLKQLSEDAAQFLESFPSQEKRGVCVSSQFGHFASSFLCSCTCSTAQIKTGMAVTLRKQAPQPSLLLPHYLCVLLLSPRVSAPWEEEQQA